jgi:L-iditol 2-dehydrogenase
MRAAFLTGINKIAIREAPVPKLQGPRDVLLRIEAVGVCGSDVHYYRSGGIGAQAVEFPWPLGHECAGHVVEAGSEARHLKPGQRVAIDPLVSCGHCDQCRADRPHTCRDQSFLGCPGQRPGALAEYLVMPAECCYPVPDSMTSAQAVMVEPFSIALHAQRLARTRPGAKIAVLGSGPIGFCVLLALRVTHECTIYATDLVDDRLQAALRGGAGWAGNPRTANIVAAIAELEPDGLDFVFECAGEQETLDQGVELLKPAGALLILGIPEAQRVGFDIHTLRRKEIWIGNVRRQNQCIGRAIELIASGTADVDPLVTHHFPLAETQAAFQMVAGYRDGVIKAMVDL